jgi:hypothetical protein
MPETLHDEMPDLRAAFAQRGVQSWVSPGNEADDLAATLACKVAKQDIRPPLSRRIKATASFWSRASAFATIFKSAGWMPPLSPASSAFRPTTPRLLGPCGHQQFKNTGGRRDWPEKRGAIADRLSGSGGSLCPSG